MFLDDNMAPFQNLRIFPVSYWEAMATVELSRTVTLAFRLVPLKRASIQK